MAGISELATGFPGYTSVRPDSAATIAQTLKLNGYNTAAFGKMHQTPVWETSASGPFDRWPSGDGFERFYGFLGGETNQWYPTLFEGISPTEPPEDPNYHFSEDMTSRAIAYMREQKAMTPMKPCFAYVAYGACHAPLQAPKPFIEKYRGKFEQGWDRQRDETFARQKELGVVIPGTLGSPNGRRRSRHGIHCPPTRSASPRGLWRPTPGSPSIPTPRSASSTRLITA
jgi:arylsulfatase A-like enzyme